MANEVRLVDANALIEDITAAEENAGMGAVAAGTLRRYVNRRPTIDPESLRAKGRWIYKWYAERDPKKLFVRIVCSECNLHTGQKSNYCPNCGAKMMEG